MAFSASGKNSATINVTPLIDVLLVLLVTFLLITPLTPKGEGARIPRPFGPAICYDVGDGRKIKCEKRLRWHSLRQS